MNKILDFIEDHKYGIIVALLLHVGLFIYFQVKTYKEVVVYEPWGFRGRNIEAPDNIELTTDQIETPQEAELFQQMNPEEVTSFVRSEDDQREKAFERGETYTSYSGDAYSNVKEFESQVIAKLQEGRKQADGASTDVKEDINTGDQGIASNNDKTGDKASEKAVAGKTMVSYDLKGRHPFNRNDWHIRNPGYTCGNVNGTVVVQIRVDQNGDVTHAKYIPEKSSGADACMIRQAEKYALLSRFNYDSSIGKSQEGTITYLFVYRK